jgi:hypothetical protein
LVKLYTTLLTGTNMAKISETELQKRLRKLESEAATDTSTVVLDNDQYLLAESVVYIAYASALSNLVNGVIPNQSDATDFQYSPYNANGVLLAYRGFFSSKSVYQSGDATDYTWESTSGLSGFTSSERFQTASTGLLSVLGNPTNPGNGVTWTVINAGSAVPSAAAWVAERFTVGGVTSGWTIEAVGAYVNSSILVDNSVTYVKIQDVTATDRILGRDSAGAGIVEEITPSALRTMLNVADGAGVITTASVVAVLTAGTNVAIAVDGTISSTDTNTTYSVQDGQLSQNNFTDADHTKLNAIEASATADQTDAEIKAAVEAATDSNVFTDADHTKLNGIETLATADQTQSDINALGITATSVDLGNWTITESSGTIFFATGGINKMKLEANGNLTTVGTVTPSGTI